MESSTSKATEKRESDATSKETLEELEQKEKVGEGSGKQRDDVPAPDSGPADQRDTRDDSGPI